MQVERLRISEYRLFKRLDIELAPGMNLVCGPNESGKSTIVGAVIECLFAKVAAKKDSVHPEQRWGGAGAPVLEMEFSHEGERYRLKKDWNAREVVLEETGSGLALDTQKAVEQRIADIVGFREPLQYRRTACVTHDQMVGLAGDRSAAKKLSVMLREVVVGDREAASMDSAERELTSQVEELRRGLERPAKNPGRIKTLFDERESLTARKKSLAGEIEAVGESSVRLGEVERELAEKSRKLEDLTSLIAKNARIGELEARRDEVGGRFTRADRLAGSRAELEQAERTISEGYPGFDGIDADVQELEREIELRESLRSLSEELREGLPEDEALPVEPSRRLGGYVSLAAGAALLVLGVILGFIRPVLFSIAVPGALLAAAGVFVLLRGRRAAAGDSAVSIDETMEKTGERIAALKRKEEDFLGSLGFEDSDAFFAAYGSYREATAERDRLAARVEALSEGRSASSAEQDRKDAALAAAAIDGELSRLDGFRLDPEKLESATREREKLAAEVAVLEKERQGLSYHLDHKSVEPEDAAELEERIAWLWESEQAARRRLRVYTIALDALAEARAAMLGSATPMLAEGVGRMFSALTGGKYRDVEIGEDDLSMTVYSEAKGGMIPADQVLSSLSRGTVSQLYLSARLELADVLSGGRKPPLIFDDSFTYFDDERIARLWSILEGAARERQILLFSCTDRYDRLAGPDTNVVQLGR